MLKRKLFLTMTLTVLLCVCMGPCFAAEGVTVEAQADEWQWKPRVNAAGTVTFTLENRSGKDLSDLILQLPAVNDGGRAWGEISFLTVGEKKIGARARGPETKLENFANGEKLTAVCEWNSPKTVAAMERAVVSLKVLSADGELLGEGKLTIPRTEKDYTVQDLPLAGMRISQWLTVLGGLSGVILILAFWRNWLRKQRETER